MSKSGLAFLKCGNNYAFNRKWYAIRSPWAKNGGPDRTRTYDPRLIKAVL